MRSYFRHAELRNYLRQKSSFEDYFRHADLRIYLDMQS